MGAGEWAQDLQEGLGTCQYMDGTVYRSDWKARIRLSRGCLLPSPSGATWRCAAR